MKKRNLKCAMALRSLVAMICVCTLLVGMVPAVSATEISAANAAEAQTAANEEDLLAFLRSEISAYMEKYQLKVDMPDQALANAYFALDTEESKEAWDKANALLVLAGDLSTKEAESLMADVNTKLCLRFYDIMKQIIESVPMLTDITITNPLPEGLEATSENELAWIIDGSTISILATPKIETSSNGCGGTSTNYVKQEDTLTLTSSVAASLTINYTVTASDRGSAQINDEPITGTGKKEISLDANGTVTISVNSGDTANSELSLTLNCIYITSGGDVTISFQPVASIEYNANDNVVDSEIVEDSCDPTEGVTITATDNHYVLVGGILVDEKGNTSKLSAIGGKLFPTVSGSLTPIFAYDVDADGVAPFLANGTTHWSWNEAMTAAAAGNKQVVLNDDHTLAAGSYEIPSGITLLIPFDSTNTRYTTEPGYVESSYTSPSAYRTLTMASGAQITVNGAISVSAKVSAKMGYAGAPTSKYGHIAMNSDSTITVNSGAKLYVWGYITGSGTVTAKSGASVYESFQVVDWRGGSASSGMLGNSKKVFPMTQYYVQNVEVSLVLEFGAYEYGSMTADISIVRQVTVPFMGPSDCMFNLTSGSVTKQYDGTKDRQVFTLNGTLSASRAQMVLVPVLATIDTQDYVLPLNSNMTFTIESGSTLNINQTASMLPGFQLYINEGGTLKIGEGKQLFVYDETEWKSNKYVYSNAHFRPVRYAPSMAYTRTNADLVDAQIVVNGTLDASAGYLYTTAGGANICSTGTGVVKVRTPESSPTLYEALQSGTSISYSSISITPAKLKNAGGDYVTTYNTTYTYDSANGIWKSNCETSGNHAEGETITGKDSTCTETGLSAGSRCAACGVVTVAQEIIPALGHAPGAAATCTTAQTCTRCNTELNTALGHTAGAAATCTAPQTCTRCGTTLQAALGHDYTSTVTTAATCTTAGVRTYTCSRCSDSYTEAIAATGHTTAVDAAVAPTCTATGLTEGSHCSVCNAVLVAQQTVAALGHTYNSAVTDPTCTEDGNTVYTCATCGDTYSEGIAALGHDYETIVIDPTCSDKGSTTYTCSTCGDSYSEEIAALGHSYNSVVTAPTCTDGGYTTNTCTVCGDVTVTGEVAALGHTEVVDAAVAATCTATGLTAGSHCETCGEVIVAQEEVAALGHKDENADKVCDVCEKGLGYSIHESMQAFLTLENEVFLNVAFKVTLDSEFQTGLTDKVGLLVWDADELPAEATYENRDIVYTGATWNNVENRYQIRTAGIPAKELGDQLAFRAYFVDDAGNYYYSKIIESYSPKTYCYNKLGISLDPNKEGKNEDTGDDALMIAILNYGAAAQNYFDYDTDNLMNANLSEEQKNFASSWEALTIRTDWTVPADKEGTLTRNKDVITSRGAYLSLLGAIDYNYYFKVSDTIVDPTVEILCWTEADYKAADVLTEENASKTITDVVYSWNTTKSRHEFKVKGLAAKEMFDAIYACAKVTDGDGRVYYSGVVAYCPERFASINVTDDDPNTQNLAKTIVIYGDAARSYFAEKNSGEE